MTDEPRTRNPPAPQAGAFSKSASATARVQGFEPRTSAPEADVLPLHHTRKNEARQDGIEPPTRGFGSRCSTTELLPQESPFDALAA